MVYLIKTQTSNLVCTTSFSNNLHLAAKRPERQRIHKFLGATIFRNWWYFSS